MHPPLRPRPRRVLPPHPPLPLGPDACFRSVMASVRFSSPFTPVSGSALQRVRVVEYTRSRGKPFGVAYMLEPDTLADHQALVLDILSEPVQRLQLCLTDAQGIVWNAPATLEQTPGRLRFDLSRLQPDPFQNRGRTLPAAAAEPSSMRMLTVLDISGFMGAPEVSCRWTIGRIELTEGLDPTRTATTGGAR